METIELGKTGEKIPVLGLGTWNLGRKPQQEIEALKEGFRLGIRFVDTAEMYHTEDIVGKALAGESGVFVATKVSPHHFHHDDVIKSCNESLRNLGIKRIDLYQLHWPNPRIPIAETMRAMEKLVADGKIRHIGVSNFSINEMEEARASMKSNEIVSNQVEYNPFVRGVEGEFYDYCRKNRITIIAYSPFGSGKLFRDKGSKLYMLLEGIGKKYGKSVAQVVLAWLVSKGNVVPIPKASSKEHVKEIAESVFRLEKDDVEEINRFL